MGRGPDDRKVEKLGGRNERHLGAVRHRPADTADLGVVAEPGVDDVIKLFSSLLDDGAK